MKERFKAAVSSMGEVASRVAGATSVFVDKAKQGVEDTLEKFTRLPNKMYEKMPADIVKTYDKLYGDQNMIMDTAGFSSYEIKDKADKSLNVDNKLNAESIFVRPCDAMLIAREMWEWIAPSGKYSTKKEKDLDAVMSRFKSYSPIYQLRIDYPDVKSVDFDDIVVSGFLNDSNNPTLYEQYFLGDNRNLVSRYKEFVEACAEFLPQFVQGNAVCKLMSAKPLMDGSTPIQNAILNNQEIIDKFVLWQYSSAIEKVMQKLQDTQKESKNEKKNIDRIFSYFLNRVEQFILRFCDNLTLSDYKEIREDVKQTRYPIYQLLLCVLDYHRNINNAKPTLLKALENHLNEFFFGAIQNPEEWQSLLISFKQDCADIDLNLDLTQFNALVGEAQADFGIELLLASSDNVVTRGLQVLFSNPTDTTLSLGPLLLNNATDEQLLAVARRYPNAAQYYVKNPERFCRPLISMVAQVSKVDDNIKKNCLTVAGSNEVLSRLNPASWAKLIAINLDAAKHIVKYIQDKQKFSEFVDMLGEECVTSEAVTLLIDNRPFMRMVFDHIKTHFARIKSSALSKLLQHCDQDICSPIYKKLAASVHPTVFMLLEATSLDVKVFRKLEDILLGYFEKKLDDKNLHFNEHMPKYLKSSKLVESPNFIQSCNNNETALNAVFETLLQKDVECLSMPWVLSFVCELIKNSHKQVAGLNYLPKLLELNPKITEELLRHREIVEALEKTGKLKNAHWDLMLKSLIADGKDLLKSPTLAPQFVLRMNDDFLTRPDFARLFEDREVGQAILNNLKHKQRALLIEKADASLMQKLFEKFDIKLLDILATCKREINNPEFYKLVEANEEWRQFMQEANQDATTPPSRRSRELRFTAEIGASCREDKLTTVEFGKNSNN